MFIPRLSLTLTKYEKAICNRVHNFALFFCSGPAVYYLVGLLSGRPVRFAGLGQPSRSQRRSWLASEFVISLAKLQQGGLLFRFLLVAVAFCRKEQVVGVQNVQQVLKGGKWHLGAAKFCKPRLAQNGEELLFECIVFQGRKSALDSLKSSVVVLQQLDRTFTIRKPNLPLFLKILPRVLFLRPKASLTRPSHSTKLTFGGGFLGFRRTTEESTLGGGRKLFRPTLIRCVTLDSNCVLTESLGR